jgi:gamma-glutamyltranspeptidase/glutathione hydrolase
VIVQETKAADAGLVEMNKGGDFHFNIDACGLEYLRSKFFRRGLTRGPLGSFLARMRPSRRTLLAGALPAVLLAGCAVKSDRSASGKVAQANRWGAVATVQPLATEAGLEAMSRGGNAVDAAVAAALMLGVVDGHNSGIGGGCFVLIRGASGKTLAIDGREMAPLAATREMFVREGKVVPGASTTGPLAIGVPGSVAAYDRALKSAGKLQLRDMLLPAAEVAERGFAIDERYAKKLADEAKDLARFPASAAIYLDGGGKPWPAGHVLRQADLAKSYRALAEGGQDWFYKGEFARRLGEWMRDNGGIVTARDFADYFDVIREPIVGGYRGYQVIGFPPPSSGGVHVQQILNLLECFSLASMDPPTRAHVMAEAMKLAFADRAFWLGDPDFTPVPRGLIDKGYARELAKRIDFARVTNAAGHGEPPRAAGAFGEDAGDPTQRKHTTHIAAADAEGNWVGITTTVNTTFGSKVVIPGTGVLMNDQMDDFVAQPGVPNAFGLVGDERNAVAPGKRPLSSMSPTVVLKDDKPVMTLGAAGGPTIISQVVQVIVNHLDLHMPIDRAVAAPRVHHQWRPDAMAVERSLDAGVVAALKEKGHVVIERDALGTCQAIGWNDGKVVAVGEPRVGGVGTVRMF